MAWATRNPSSRMQAGQRRGIGALAGMLGLLLVCASGAAQAQVETHVPEPVPGAPSVAVERITVHAWAQPPGSVERG